MRVLILSLCLVAGPVRAVNGLGGYTIYGYGAISCGQVVEEYRTNWDELKYYYNNHISGAITTYNHLRFGKADWFESTDNMSRLLFVVNYCKENPLDKFDQGVNALIRKVAPTFGTNLID